MVCVGKLNTVASRNGCLQLCSIKAGLVLPLVSFKVYIYVFAGSSTVFNKEAHTEQLNQLTKIFPAHEVTFLKEVLDKSGSVNDAVAVIVGDQEISCSSNGMWIQIKVLH